MVIIHTWKDKLLYKYIFNTKRYPRHANGFKGVLANGKSVVYELVKNRDWGGASRSFEMFTASLLEYLNACNFFFGYPLISFLVLLVIGLTFSLAQAGCVLVALAICVEGFSVMALQKRMKYMEMANKAPSIEEKDKYGFRQHLKNLQSIHPNLLKWSLANAVIGTLLWGFAPASLAVTKTCAV